MSRRRQMTPSLTLDFSDLPSTQSAPEPTSPIRIESSTAARATKSLSASPRKNFIRRISMPSSPLSPRRRSSITRSQSSSEGSEEDVEALNEQIREARRTIRYLKRQDHELKERIRRLTDTEKELITSCKFLSSKDRSVSFSSLISKKEKHLGWDTVEKGKLIGRGGSTTRVYKCYQDHLVFAMKELLLDQANAKDIEGFQWEVNIMSRLPSHPNLLPMLHSSSTTVHMRVFMPLYDGTLLQDINERARSDNFFSVEEVAELAGAVASGLAALHAQRIMHRDVKADNVFLRYGGDGEISKVVLADFDTAFVCGAKCVPTKAIGTPGFMAPETFNSKDENEYHFEADIYSFGMLLYQLCTLKMPYHDAKNMKSLSDRVAKGDPPVVSSKTERKYMSIIALHKGCIHPNPKKRPGWENICASLAAVAPGAVSPRLIERR